MNDFIECNECAQKTGSPILCKSCQNNRSVIEELNRESSVKTIVKLLEEIRFHQDVIVRANKDLILEFAKTHKSL